MYEIVSGLYVMTAFTVFLFSNAKYNVITSCDNPKEL